MRIFVIFKNIGEKFSFDVQKNISVQELKLQILRKVNYLRMYHENFDLIYDGERLNDYDSLYDYDIENEDVLMVEPIVHGGGYSLENDYFSTNIHAVNKRENIGNTYYYKIKGSNEGTVWGDNIYTDDSNIAKAAVLEGKCKLGEEKIVGIKMLEGKPSYSSSYKNGVNSISYGTWPASYIFIL